ncbi:hypothetical protein BB399_00835 [Helicobacter pylori]|nr:hypothetical protein BB399_00835 [Helicobacter pylori]
MVFVGFKKLALFWILVMKSKKYLLGVLTTKIKKLAKAIISHNALLGGYGDFLKKGVVGE